MKLFVFSVKYILPNGRLEIAIVQVYATSKHNAESHLTLITGCKKENIMYHGEEETAVPLMWDYDI